MIPKKPTASQKAAAHAFLRDDLPWTDAVDRKTAVNARQGSLYEGLGADDINEAQDRAVSADKADSEGLPVADMRGRITDRNAALSYIQAGNATVTLVSKASGSRFTYRFRRPKEERGKDRPIWVSLLSGPDNEANYTFLGTIWVKDGVLLYWHGKRSTVGKDAPSVRGIEWLLQHLQAPFDNKFDQVEFWHEGRCCRCGRKLTVPSSVESGIGPECATKMGG